MENCCSKASQAHEERNIRYVCAMTAVMQFCSRNVVKRGIYLMDWTIFGALVAVVALVSGWFWWWKPRQTGKNSNSLGNVDLGKSSESGKVSSEVEMTGSASGNAGNVKLGAGAKSKDIETKVTVNKSD